MVIKYFLLLVLNYLDILLSKIFLNIFESNISRITQGYFSIYYVFSFILNKCVRLTFFSIRRKNLFIYDLSLMLLFALTPVNETKEKERTEVERWRIGTWAFQFSYHGRARNQKRCYYKFVIYKFVIYNDTTITNIRQRNAAVWRKFTVSKTNRSVTN